MACFRVALVRKKIPEFSWLHCGRLNCHLVNHVTVRDRTMACNFFLFPSHKVKWRSKSPNEVPVSPKSVSVLRVCLLLLLLAINAVNALWHPHTPVLSTDEREIWAVKIVRSSCQRCKTWIFRIKISNIVWVETYKGSFVVLIYSIDNQCILLWLVEFLSTLAQSMACCLHQAIAWVGVNQERCCACCSWLANRGVFPCGEKIA